MVIVHNSTTENTLYPLTYQEFLILRVCATPQATQPPLTQKAGASTSSVHLPQDHEDLCKEAVHTETLNCWLTLSEIREALMQLPEQHDLISKLCEDGQIETFLDTLCRAGMLQYGEGHTQAALDADKNAAYSLTHKGLSALEPHKVRNAIIMAAGFSSRFAPISYEQPKGTISVRGEVLIERQIEQLHEAGIFDITVVVGYKKEAFFYLAEKFGVTLMENLEYQQRNNNSTLMLVKDKLHNTYICSSDNYFTINVFNAYEYHAYYSCCLFEGDTDEYCVTADDSGRIIAVDPRGGHHAYGMLGHVYFDEAFSRAFIEFLEQDYDRPQTPAKLWEDIYLDHLDDLDMNMQVYDKAVVQEFDSLNDLLAFDPGFIDRVSSEVLDNICSLLACSRHDITVIRPLKEGFTNLSFLFSVRGAFYVYRHPGPGTEETLNRESEKFSQEKAAELGLDPTYIYQDDQHGWKISRFIPDAKQIDYHNFEQIKTALRLIKKLHDCGDISPYSFDIFKKSQQLFALVSKIAGISTAPCPNLAQAQQHAEELNELLLSDNPAYCLCHNDFYPPNLLISASPDGSQADQIAIIDWEYSGRSPYVFDIANFANSSYYSFEEFERVVDMYYGRPATPIELRMCYAATALTGYYWFVWAIHKEATGVAIGDWIEEWYRVFVSYGDKARKLYHRDTEQ